MACQVPRKAVPYEYGEGFTCPCLDGGSHGCGRDGRLSNLSFGNSPTTSGTEGLVLPKNLEEDGARLEGKTLPFRIKINEQGISALEITAYQQEIQPGKPSFEQAPKELVWQQGDIGRKDYEMAFQVPLKLEKPGTYKIDILLVGKSSANAGFSDRFVRYIVKDERGATLLSPKGYGGRAQKTREAGFLDQNRANPENHPIRLLFADTAKIPAQLSGKVQPMSVPTEQQMEVRSEGPSEFLRKHSVDHSKTSWSSSDGLTIRGRLLFQDIDGMWKPLVNVSVNLWDSDSLIDENLGNVASGWDGRWSFAVNDDDGWLQDGRDIYYTFKLENTRLSTGSCSFLSGAYEWKSAVHDDLSDGTVLDFGDETAGDNMEALQVWSTLNLGWNHASVVGGWDPGKIGSCFPSSGTFYDGNVNVDGSDNDGPDSITHEYGHGLMAHAYSGGDPSPGGDHGFGDCNQNQSLSWSEGWATGFMLSARPDGTYNWHEGQPGQAIEAFSSTCHLGETQEGWVADALLDMMDFANDDNGDVGQAEVAALEAVGQLRVVEAEQVQHRGVQVVDVDLVLDDVEAELVGLAERDARLDAAAGQPHREGVGMMVAAVVCRPAPSACGRTRRPR